MKSFKEKQDSKKRILDVLSKGIHTFMTRGAHGQMQS